VVHEVVKLFAEAFVLSLAIFLSGLFLGLMLDTWRSDEIAANIANVEAELTDIYQFSQFTGDGNVCPWMLEELLLLNERLYEEGRRIEEYEAANKLTTAIVAQKRQYIALKALFLSLIEKLKRECNYDYHVVIHFYKRYRATKQELAMDRATAEALLDAKYSCGRSMILVPLQVDLNLMSVRYFLHYYGISAYPAVVVDGKVVAEGRVLSREELRRLLGC